MTIHVYNCETATIRTEMVKRTKSEGVFVGLRIHMNTDQAITFWSTTQDGLREMVRSLLDTVATPLELISEKPALPGQLSRS